MARDIKAFEITDVYAYNSNFDDNVFSFNCDWFKTINPLENVAIHDIWGYASQFITNHSDYQNYCETHNLFTKTGNYSGNAESVWRYITNDSEFTEDHIGLYDSEIEMGILLYCLHHGAILDTDYKVITVLKREIEHPFTIKVNDTIIFTGTYIKKYNKNDTYYFKTNRGA